MKGKPLYSSLTHPHRVIYRQEGLTKLDVADYYNKINQWILPHIKDHPLTLVRCLKSSTEACFFSKHLPKNLAIAVNQIPEPGKKPILAVDTVRGLMSLVQAGALEFHTWNTHAENLEQPNQIVWDFDPGENIEFEAVREGALELKELLEQIGLRSFVKATGSKGVHVQLPIEPLYGWDLVKVFAKTLVMEMVSRHPRLFTVQAKKAQRQSRIFIDYLRNTRGATAIAPYSLRAREFSSVAMPLTWEEFETLPSSDFYTLNRALEHVSQPQRKDPWRDYFRTKQKIVLLS